MKRFLPAVLSFLMIGFAIDSPRVMAQGVNSADLTTMDAVPAQPSSISHPPSTILSYTRPTHKEKLKLYEFDAFGPYAFAKAAVAGGYQQSEKVPPEWGGGGAGPFGERLASNFGIQLVTTTTRYGMAELLHEDAVYYPCSCKGFSRRFTHAVISTLTARHGSDGHATFSISGLVAPLRRHDDGTRLVSRPLRCEGRLPNGKPQPGYGCG